MAARYALPAPYFYIDKAGAAKYEAKQTGAEVVGRHKLNAPAGAVLDAWLQHIWIAGFNSEQLQPGEGRGLVNYERFIPALQTAEQIKSVGVPSDSDEPGAVVSILYEITKAGDLPFTDHIGLVRFIEDENKQTEVVWTVKLTFKPDADGEAFTANVTKALTASIAGLEDKIVRA